MDEDGKMAVNNLVASAAATAAKTSAVTPPASTTGTTPAGTAQGKTTAPTNPDEVNQTLNTQLRALVTRLGGKAEIIDALIDWLDLNDEVTGSGGAEEAYYKPLGYHCKNGPLDSLDELLLIRGFDNDLVNDRNLRADLTVAPTDGKINVNTAPLEVFQAVLGTQTSLLAQPLSDADIEDLVHYRDEHDLRSISDIMAVKISQGDLGKITPLIKVNSSYFTVNSKYTIGKVVKNVEALLKRDGTTVSIISWRES